MPLRRKAVDISAWHLSDQTAMVEALTALNSAGWRGGIAFSEGTWRIELNADSPTRQIIATVGDWLVDDLGLRLLTAEEVADNYDEVTE